MRGLVSLCVRHFGIVTALSMLALMLGCWGVTRSPLDVFPEFVPSQVDIQTEAPGFAPEQVEELVTKRIENAVNGAAGLATLRSESIPGLSVITITFTDNVDVHIARQGISERLSEIGSALPAGVGAPKLSPLVSSTMDLLKIGLQSDTVDGYALRDAAEWVIKPRLLAVPGVAHVIVFGGDVRQIQIQPDPNKLSSYHVTLMEVADAARGALALHGAGFIDLAAQRVLLRSPTPKPDLAAIGQAVIAGRKPRLARSTSQGGPGTAFRRFLDHGQTRYCCRSPVSTARIPCPRPWRWNRLLRISHRPSRPRASPSTRRCIVRRISSSAPWEISSTP
jgi:Cu/Ag efflux pump CusA